MQATSKRLQLLFYWKGLERDVRNYVRGCATCQACKPENVNMPGMLQPLPIPEGIWSDLSMDFIEGLPRSKGKEVILVIVDRLSKYAHFIALCHPYSATLVAQLFFNIIFKVHGMPTSIVSDHDQIFISQFWEELFKLQGVDLKKSIAYHLQTDGQTEVVNRCLETYLRCMTGKNPHQWV